MSRRRPQPTTPIEAVGMELRFLRERRDVTQAELAEAVGLSRSGYQLYERGLRGIPLNDLYKIMEVLDDDAGNLLERARENYAPAFKHLDVTQAEDLG